MDYEYKIGDKVKLINNINTSIPLNTIGEIVGHTQIEGRRAYFCRFPKEIDLDSGYPKTFLDQVVHKNEIVKA